MGIHRCTQEESKHLNNTESACTHDPYLDLTGPGVKVVHPIPQRQVCNPNLVPPLKPQPKSSLQRAAFRKVRASKAANSSKYPRDLRVLGKGRGKKPAPQAERRQIEHTVDNSDSQGSLSSWSSPDSEVAAPNPGTVETRIPDTVETKVPDNVETRKLEDTSDIPQLMEVKTQPPDDDPYQDCLYIQVRPLQSRSEQVPLANHIGDYYECVGSLYGRPIFKRAPWLTKAYVYWLPPDRQQSSGSWWIGQNIACSRVLARCESDDGIPPSNGWKTHKGTHLVVVKAGSSVQKMKGVWDEHRKKCDMLGQGSLSKECPALWQDQESVTYGSEISSRSASEPEHIDPQTQELVRRRVRKRRRRNSYCPVNKDCEMTKGRHHSNHVHEIIAKSLDDQQRRMPNSAEAPPTASIGSKSSIMRNWRQSDPRRWEHRDVRPTNKEDQPASRERKNPTNAFDRSCDRRERSVRSQRAQEQSSELTSNGGPRGQFHQWWLDEGDEEEEETPRKASGRSGTQVNNQPVQDFPKQMRLAIPPPVANGGLQQLKEFFVHEGKDVMERARSVDGVFGSIDAIEMEFEDAHLDMLISWICHHAVPCQRLRLWSNQIRDMRPLCNLICHPVMGVTNPNGIKELHLSQNRICLKGVRDLLESIRRAKIQANVKTLSLPVWLRVERNSHDINRETIQDLAKELQGGGFNLCQAAGKSNGCSVRYCAHGADVHVHSEGANKPYRGRWK